MIEHLLNYYHTKAWIQPQQREREVGRGRKREREEGRKRKMDMFGG